MAAAWKLIIEDDAGKQIVVPFSKDVITIGRKEGNTIRLTERNVSRFHAKLQKENGHVLVEDLGSFNGIRLNGDRIAGRVAVNEGDTIQIGDYHLALHAAEGAGAAKPQAPAAGAHRSAAVDGQPTQAEDDEFAGDTQRWEPPGDMAPMAVGALQTQEEVRRPPSISEETARSAIQGVSQMDTQEGYAADPGQATERYTAATGQPAPPQLEAIPSRKSSFSGNLEPTVRQPVAAPAPISGVGGGAPPSMIALGAEPHGETRPERPLPGPSLVGSGPLASSGPMPAPQAPAPPSSPAAAMRPTTSGVKLALSQTPAEQTEAIRPAPVAGEDLSTPRLFVVNTVFCGSAFRLVAPEMVIGRTEENDITIEHRSVSRNHAKIVREGDRVRVLDLKSANGVLVNGEEVEAAVLRSGDIVELGRVKLRFVPIGERFSVTADEIERARIADTAGDEFEGEGSTGITNPVRNRGASDAASAPHKNNLILYAAIGGVVVLGGIMAVLLLGGDPAPDEDAPQPDVVVRADPAPSPPPAVVPDPPPPDPTPVDTKPVPVPDPAPAPTPDPAPDPAPVDAQPPDPQPDPDEANPAGDPRPRPPRRPPPDRTPAPKKMSKEEAKERVTQATKAFFGGDANRCLKILADVLKDYPTDPDAKRVQATCKK